MSINFLSRLAALVGLSDEGVSPTTDEVLTATETRLQEVEALKSQLEASSIELEQLRAEQADLAEQRAAAEKATEEERAGRIEAELRETLAHYDEYLGKASMCALTALLREDVSGNGITRDGLLAFVDTLPKGGPAPSGTRTELAQIDVEAVAAEAAGTLDVDKDAQKHAAITAIMKDRKCDYATAWAVWQKAQAKDE